MRDTTHWVGTWTATPAPGEGAAFSNHTLRMIPRVSIGGSVLRVRISNAYGTRPLAIGAARVGVRSTGPAVVAGSNRRLTFSGEPSATIAAGALLPVGAWLTDANISPHDGHHSWPSQLARRLMARQSGRPMAVMNQGLGGNRILHDIRGDSGLRRFDRDVLAQPGVTHAVIMLGTNDLRNRWGKPEEEVTAPQMIAGLKQFAVRGQARGIRVIGGTLTPFENETFLPGAWNPKREAIRQEVNEWLRKTDAFDAIVDFDQALRDPDHPTRRSEEHTSELQSLTNLVCRLLLE